MSVVVPSASRNCTARPRGLDSGAASGCDTPPGKLENRATTSTGAPVRWPARLMVLASGVAVNEPYTTSPLACAARRPGATPKLASRPAMTRPNGSGSCVAFVCVIGLVPSGARHGVLGLGDPPQLPVEPPPASGTGGSVGSALHPSSATPEEDLVSDSSRHDLTDRSPGPYGADNLPCGRGSRGEEAGAR